MPWNTVRLELAQCSEFPRGSVGRGYLVRVPLNNAGEIDKNTLEREPHKASVRRFWSSDPDEMGHIVPVDGHFAFRCEGRPDRLIPIQSQLSLGNMVEIICSKGKHITFRIADIRPLQTR